MSSLSCGLGINANQILLESFHLACKGSDCCPLAVSCPCFWGNHEVLGEFTDNLTQIKVMIVVCIILYYEKASASKNIEGNDEEGGEFLSKKEEN